MAVRHHCEMMTHLTVVAAAAAAEIGTAGGGSGVARVTRKSSMRALSLAEGLHEASRSTVKREGRGTVIRSGRRTTSRQTGQGEAPREGPRQLRMHSRQKVCCQQRRAGGAH